MRGALLALAVALAPAAALAQGVRYDPTSEWYRPGSEWVPAASASGVVDWGRSWSETWYGATAPTISCTAAASGGDLVCSGATPTKVGSPTTVAAYGVPARTAVALTATAYHTLGDTGDATTALTVAVVTKRTSGFGYPIAKYTMTGGDSSWAINDSGAGSWSLRVCSAPNSCTSGTVTAVANGQWVAFAASYRYVTSGTSVILTNVNGTATSASNAVGPIANSATELQVGALSFVGAVASAAVWTGWSASADELAALVASQQAKLAANPAGAAITWTSPPVSCQPTGTGGLYALPANVPCATWQGVAVPPAQNLRLLNNEDMTAAGGWTISNTTVATDQASFWADGSSPTMERWTTTGTAINKKDASGFTSSTGPFTSSNYLSAASGTPTVKVFAQGASQTQAPTTCACARSDGGACSTETATGVCYAVATLPASGIVRVSATAIFQAATTLVYDGIQAATGQDFYIGGAQVEPTAGPTPWVAVAGTPYSGAGAVDSRTRAKPTDRCVGLRATAMWDAKFDRTIWAQGSGANTSNLRVNATSLFVYSTFDAANAQRFVSTTASGTGEHTLISCRTVDGAMSIRVDGTLYDTTNGTGTGVLATEPTTMTVGHAAGGAPQINGQIRCLVEGASEPIVRRELNRRCP